MTRILGQYWVNSGCACKAGINCDGDRYQDGPSEGRNKEWKDVGPVADVGYEHPHRAVQHPDHLPGTGVGVPSLHVC